MASRFPSDPIPSLESLQGGAPATGYTELFPSLDEMVTKLSLPMYRPPALSSAAGAAVESWAIRHVSGSLYSASARFFDALGVPQMTVTASRVFPSPQPVYPLGTPEYPLYFDKVAVHGVSGISVKVVDSVFTQWIAGAVIYTVVSGSAQSAAELEMVAP